MTIDNLFPEEPKPKKKKSFQHQLLDYLRTGKIITEAIYKKEIGGSSVSAAIHNLRMRGNFEKGEFIVHEKVRDSEGSLAPGYRLAKETPPVDFPQKEPEIDQKGFSERAGEPSLEMVDRELDAWSFHVGVDEPEVGESDFAEYISDEDVPVLNDTPRVSSIMVGVRRHDPELIVMFEGEFKPLRHVLTKMEVQYLLINLEAFRPKKRQVE